MIANENTESYEIQNLMFRNNNQPKSLKNENKMRFFRTEFLFLEGLKCRSLSVKRNPFWKYYLFYQFHSMLFYTKQIWSYR